MTVMQDFDELPNLRPSKSERKRAMEALLTLAEELVELTAGRFAKLTLPDELKEALVLARRLPNRGAKKRQLAYIRRIMENYDAEAIREDLKKLH